jgi:hypothetical protein
MMTREVIQLWREPRQILHELRHNRDEALPTHSSRLPLLHNSAMLGFWKHLGNLRQRVTFKFAFYLNITLADLDFLQPH